MTTVADAAASIDTTLAAAADHQRRVHRRDLANQQLTRRRATLTAVRAAHRPSPDDPDAATAIAHYATQALTPPKTRWARDAPGVSGNRPRPASDGSIGVFIAARKHRRPLTQSLYPLPGNADALTLPCRHHAEVRARVPTSIHSRRSPAAAGARHTALRMSMRDRDRCEAARLSRCAQPARR
jgi:hypothetical protein